MKRKTRADLAQELSIERYARGNAEEENTRLRKLLDKKIDEYDQRLEDLDVNLAESQRLVRDINQSVAKYSETAILLLIKSFQMSLELDGALLSMAIHGSPDVEFRDSLGIAARNNRQIRAALEMLTQMPLTNSRDLSAEHIVNSLMSKA